MAWKWFVQKDDKVEGPLFTEDVQSRLSRGQFTAKDLIWGQGLEWQSLQTWTAQVAGLTLQPQRGIGPQAWHYATGGQSFGPMNRGVLIRELKQLGNGNYGGVMIWTKGMTEWAPVFEFHDLLSELGVNKRQFPRIDASGKVVFKGETALIAPLNSLSEGGFGISVVGGLPAGSSVTVEIQANAIRNSIHARAEVRYVGDGVVGLKFTQISAENKNQITQLIRQAQIHFPLKAAA